MKLFSCWSPHWIKLLSSLFACKRHASISLNCSSFTTNSLNVCNYTAFFNKELRLRQKNMVIPESLSRVLLLLLQRFMQRARWRQEFYSWLCQQLFTCHWGSRVWMNARPSAVAKHLRVMGPFALRNFARRQKNIQRLNSVRQNKQREWALARSPLLPCRSLARIARRADSISSTLCCFQKQIVTPLNISTARLKVP